MADQTTVMAGTQSKSFKLSNGKSMTVVKDDSLNLFVITDCNNLGPEWIKIHHKKGIFTTSYLLGSREDVMCPIARFLAPVILGIDSKTDPNGDVDGERHGDNGIEPDPFVVVEDDEKEVTLSISLRDTDPKTVREIKQLLEQSTLDIVPVIRPGYGSR